MNILDNRFDYTYAINHRLEIPNQFIKINSKKILIELLVTNGFVKIYTFKGRIYHIKQNIDNHTVPDWKFHFNVKPEEIPKAFNIVSDTLIKHIIQNTKDEDIIDDIFISMKAYNINLCTKMQEGREITLYIYTFDERLNEDPVEIDVGDENGKLNKIKYVFRKDEEKKFKFYLDLLIDIENQFKKMKIKKRIDNRCAYGDLWLGEYASLRNEAYCQSDNGGYIYPPNDKGWNSLKQKIPFNWIYIFLIRYALVYKYKPKNFYFGFLSIIVLIISIVFYIFLSFFIYKNK